MIIYDGVKVMLILFALLLLIAMACGRWLTALKPYQAAIRVNFLSLLITPFFVGGLKATTNVACPAKLQQYGGDVPFIGVFESYPYGEKPESLQRCFPAGHASGGFALLGLLLFFRSRLYQSVATCGVLTLGWSMGGYKMIIGDHFFSHTLVTMWLSILVLLMLILPWKKQLIQQGRLFVD